ncbi:hypothetical protein [Nocardioides sp.]|jgi:hypothetical protein|uniref:hypothetical protein n=1 Tax=Nocardioides sp. TaxID=35761 RepID=UPI002F3E898F
MTSSIAHPQTPTTTRTDRPGQEAFWILRTAFTVAPILFGLDKFANVMTNWPKYLAGQFNDLIPGDAHQAMLMVGVIEVVAGLLVFFRPRIGAYVVVLWLAGIITNLLLIGGYGDVALRDFGLLLAALALARIAPAYSRR